MAKRKIKADPLDFTAAFSMDDFQQAKKRFQDFAFSRNLALISLTKGGRDMAQLAWVDGDAFIELLQISMDYQTFLEAELNVIKTAVFRMITVGKELSDHGKPSFVVGDQKIEANA